MSVFFHDALSQATSTRSQFRVDPLLLFEALGRELRAVNAGLELRLESQVYVVDSRPAEAA